MSTPVSSRQCPPCYEIAQFGMGWAKRTPVASWGIFCPQGYRPHSDGLTFRTLPSQDFNRRIDERIEAITDKIYEELGKAGVTGVKINLEKSKISSRKC